MGVEEGELERKRNREVEPNLNTKRRKYGHLRLMAADNHYCRCYYVRVISKERSRNLRNRMDIWNKHKEEMIPKSTTLLTIR